MRDRPIILAALFLSLAVLTFPFWRNTAAGITSRAPDVPLPKAEKQCVAPRAYMRSSHMDLLIGWRENAVRNGIYDYKAFNGKVYNVSLTGTCLRQCHTSKADFCDRCHNYAAVSLTCWDCHVDPGQTRPVVAAVREVLP